MTSQEKEAIIGNLVKFKLIQLDTIRLPNWKFGVKIPTFMLLLDLSKTGIVIGSN